MNTAPILIQENFDKEFINEMEKLRYVRIGLAEKQLENLEETAHKLTHDGFEGSKNSELFIYQLKTELIKKINDLKKRALNKDVFFADEISFYLSLLEEEPEAIF